MKRDHLAQRNARHELGYKLILTAKEVSEYTGYSLKYLYKLTHLRQIPVYRPSGGRRLFFKLVDIEEWLLNHKILTVDEILALQAK